MAISSSGTPSARKIRVGIIGAGQWANHGHLRVLDLLPDYEVTAIYAGRKEAAEAAAATFRIPHVADSEEDLLARPDIDLVAVLNTTPHHAATVRASIAAGKNVYCEWPLTVSADLAAELAKLARDAGVRHVAGLQRRLAPHNRYLRDLLAKGYVGNLRSVRLHVSTHHLQAVRPHAMAWTARPENATNGIVIFGGHFLDMLFHAAGKPISVSALLRNQFKEITIAETGEVIPTTAPDQLVVAGTLGGAAVLSVHVESGKRNGSGVQIDITGDAGDLRITNSSAFGDIGDDYVIEGAQGDNQPLTKLEVPASYNWLSDSDLPSAVLELANLYVAFARDFAGGTSTAPSFDDAVWLRRFFDVLNESSAKGVCVSLG